MLYKRREIKIFPQNIYRRDQCIDTGASFLTQSRINDYELHGLIFKRTPFISTRYPQKTMNTAKY
jgi:hypothetical protein